MAGFRDKAREITDQLEHVDDAHRAWLRDEAIPIIARALSEAFASGYDTCLNAAPTKASSLTQERQIESALALAKESFEKILNKRPNAVDRNEAADMAIEFQIVAREALAAIEKLEDGE